VESSSSGPLERIGIFGGTFDPPHVGHLIVAAEACEVLELDRLVLIPSAVPPHKQTTVRASAEQRLRMLRAATAGDQRMHVDDLELRRAGPSYTVDTLRIYRERFPGAELFFLIGVDAVRELHTWHDPDGVKGLATLAVLSRGGEQIEDDAGLRQVPVSRIDISATGVRGRVAMGRSIRYFVPEAVERIIREDGLYR
jgi:nicotinate-nucleotide adenylyltransferase